VIEEKEEEKMDQEVKRQPCEVYSRVVGYIRPVAHWNDSKKAEYEDRLEFRMPEAAE
jgi:ribonucleoside-triphosphate reductase